MKKAVFLGFILLFVSVGAFSLKEKSYSDVKSLINNLIKEEEILIQSISKTNKADEIEKAIKKFSAGMAKLYPKIGVLDEKYPELKDTETIPQSLKKLTDKWRETNQKLYKNLMKVQKKWGDNASLQKSIKDMLSQYEILGDDYAQYQLKNENSENEAKKNTPKDYKDLKKAIHDLIGVEETFIKAMDESKSKEDVIKALKNMTLDFVKMKPVFKEMDQKYPELKNLQNIPETMKEDVKKLQDLTTKLGKYIGDLNQKWKNEPSVLQAFQDFITQMQ